METMKEKADKIRLEILACSDEDLVYYSHAIYSETFEKVSERISKVAAEHKKSMPF